MARQLSEQSVKRRLKIASFDNVPSEKMSELAKIIHTIPREEASNIIRSIGNIAEFGKAFVQESSVILKKITESNDFEAMEIHNHFKIAIDALSNSLERNTDKPDVQEEIRKEINELLKMEIDFARENRQFRKKWFDYVRDIAGMIGGALAVLILLVVAYSKNGNDN